MRQYLPVNLDRRKILLLQLSLRENKNYLGAPKLPKRTINFQNKTPIHLIEKCIFSNTPLPKFIRNTQF